jgi:hypothetical protein
MRVSQGMANTISGMIDPHQKEFDCQFTIKKLFSKTMQWISVSLGKKY